MDLTMANPTPAAPSLGGAPALTPQRLDPQAVTEKLPQLPGWAFDPARGGLLQREFIFRDFSQAFAFMAQVAAEAERRNHHPEWFNVYHRVRVTLTTHDVQGVSALDIDMALLMNRLAAASGVSKG